MSARRPSDEMPSEEDNPRTIYYDLNSPFWQDTEDDHGDIDYAPAPGDSEEDDGLNFQGEWVLFALLLVVQSCSVTDSLTDAAESLSGVEIELEIEDGDEDEDEDGEDGEDAGEASAPRLPIASMVLSQESCNSR